MNFIRPWKFSLVQGDEKYNRRKLIDKIFADKVRAGPLA